jgi:hypothetical protein
MSNNWKIKLLNHEETPPPGLWESISNKLDKEAETPWQEKILNHEETPPVGLWDNIATALDNTKNETPVISIKAVQKNKIGFWRMAAAASIVGLIVASVFVFTKKGDTQLETIATVKNTTPLNEVASSVDTPSTTPSPINESTTETLLLRNDKITKHSIAKKQKPTIPEQVDIDIELSYTGVAEVAALAPDPSKIKSDKLTNEAGEIINDMALLNAPNTYITIIGPDGESVKVSSKFSKMINAITDKKPGTEEYIDKVIKESKFWRGKFSKWRDKMINNTLAPSPTNFMDVIELSKLVKE